MKLLILIFALAISFSANAQKPAPLKYGKYGCTASKYRNGSYEYSPKGSFTITQTGDYTYNGFSKPSKGKFSINSKGELSFKGGYFNGGKAELTGRPDKFFVTFPSNPDNRWTCTCVN